MQDMDLKKWIESSFGTTVNGAAVAANIQPATLFRQVKSGKLSADNVIALCQAHDKSVANGLVEVGICTWSDFETVGVEEALTRATNAQFVQEMERRLEQGHGDEFTTPAEIDTSKVHNLNQHRSIGSDSSPAFTGNHDDLIERINSGAEPVAAQKATEPLEENQP